MAICHLAGCRGDTGCDGYREFSTGRCTGGQCVHFLATVGCRPGKRQAKWSTYSEVGGESITCRNDYRGILFWPSF